MKKKVIVISVIMGSFIMGLCIKSAVRGRGEPVIENAVMKESTISDDSNGVIREREDKTETPLEIEPECEYLEEEQIGQESEEQDQIAIPERILFQEPVVELNGEAGELWDDWDSHSIQVDEETFLLVSDCYFSDRTLQQKIFFLAEAPDFELQEVFRQYDKVPDLTEWSKERMRRPRAVEEGWLYEVDKVLYLLNKYFQKAEPICDLADLLGDLYSFSPNTSDSCDITGDASKLVACTDKGLYEYDLESKEKTLLETASFAYREISEEGGDCGVYYFEFDGPVEVEYAPDEQSYAFLTGTEEAERGDFCEAVLRSRDGKDLYRKKTEYMYGFRWIEAEDKDYLAVFYCEDDSYWLDRVDAGTGKVETFEMPFYGYMGAVFLDEDTLVDFSKNDNLYLGVYRLSTGGWQDLKIKGEVDWKINVYRRDGYTYPVRYPKNFA